MLIKKNWKAFRIIFIFFLVVCVSLNMTLFFEVHKPVLEGSLFPNDWNWYSLYGGYLSLIVLNGIIILSCYFQLTVKVDENGVSQLGYTGRQLISWADITDVKMQGVVVEILSQNKSIKFSRLFYIEPEKFVEDFLAILKTHNQSFELNSSRRS